MAGAKGDLFPEYLEQDAKANAKCEALVRKSSKSPYMKFLLQAFRNLGAPLSLEHIMCQTCPEDTTMCGGFDPDKALIRLCSNRVVDMPQKYFNIALAHEMIHAYDHCRAHVDWSNMEHFACSEIRACALSKECFYKYQKRRKLPYHNGDIERCIKPRTVTSLVSMGVTESEAIRITHKVYEHCFNDTAPFDRVP